MTGLGAIGEFPIGGPPQPITGTWASTEGKDALVVHGGVLGGALASDENKDTFAALGHPEETIIVREIRANHHGRRAVGFADGHVDIAGIIVF